jgi:hypothetical protein
MGEPNMPIMMVDQYHHDWLSHYTTYHDIIMIDEKQWDNHNVDGREILHQLKNHPFGGAGFRNHPQYHGSPRCIRKHSKSSILYRYSHNFFSKKKRRTANHKSKIALTKLKRTSTKKCRLSAPRISNTASVKPSTGPSQSAYHLLSNRRIWEPCCAVNLRSTSLADVTRMISQTQKNKKRLWFLGYQKPSPYTFIPAYCLEETSDCGGVVLRDDSAASPYWRQALNLKLQLLGRCRKGTPVTRLFSFRFWRQHLVSRKIHQQLDRIIRCTTLQDSKTSAPDMECTWPWPVWCTSSI